MNNVLLSITIHLNIQIKYLKLHLLVDMGLFTNELSAAVSPVTG